MPVSLTARGDRLSFSGLKCACGGAHHAPTQDLFVGRDLTRKLPRYVKKRELGEKAVMIVDQIAYEAAGRDALEAFRKEGFEVTLVVLSGVRADERALGEALLAMRLDTEFFVGVGAEAVAQVTRAAAAQTERPYVLLPTQPSGCSYLSQQAKMILRGEPMILPAVAPEIVAFDLSVLMAAPAESYAQGLADLAACHLARADWAALALLRGDPFCPLCADLAVEAAERAFSAIPDIASRSEDGARKMTESLLMAGVAAYVSGGARPVSSLAHSIALRASLSGDAPYGELLPGAVAGVLDAYRAAGLAENAATGEAGARRALQAHFASVRQILDRLPSGDQVAGAIGGVAPEAVVAPSALEWPPANGISSCETLADYLAIAGNPLVS